mgnify:CR=1 FL=1
MDLIKLGNNLSHSMRNRNNRKYQVFVFHHDEKLIEDLLHLTGQNSINRKYKNEK